MGNREWWQHCLRFSNDWSPREHQLGQIELFSFSIDFGVSGDSINSFREMLRPSGLYPVLISSVNLLDWIGPESGDEFARVIQAAENIDPLALLKSWGAEDEDYPNPIWVTAESGQKLHELFDRLLEGLITEEECERQAKVLGVHWTDWCKDRYQCAHCVTAQKQKESIANPSERPMGICLVVPADEPWKIPAYMMIGTGGHDHEPAEHVAIHKRWYTHYGATISRVSNCTIDVDVLKPPLSKDEAKSLASECHAYCRDDLPEPCAVPELTGHWLNSSTWHFWWD
jgi:hypothetical protein